MSDTEKTPAPAPTEEKKLTPGAALEADLTKYKASFKSYLQYGNQEYAKSRKKN
jgi:hypothetical protein